MVPLDFLEDNVTWVASKLSGATWAMGDEAIEINNWLLLFVCASEEFRFAVANVADCMANYSPPWAAYRAMMSCHLLSLDKCPGVSPVGLGETVIRAISKLVMRVAGDQTKTAGGSLQLSAVIEAGI